MEGSAEGMRTLWISLAVLGMTALIQAAGIAIVFTIAASSALAACDVGRRWVFDLLLSNPSAARLYRLPFAKYAAQTGRQIH